MAVGRRLGGDRSANRAAGATAVLDEERLAELLRERLLHDARDDIGAATRRVRHDERHWLRRPGERRGREGCENEGREHGSHGAIVGAGVTDQLRNCPSLLTIVRSTNREPLWLSG